MRAAVLVEPGRIEMEERPIPTPAAGDVLIRVSSVGVCGSDTHYYRHGRVGSFVVDAPLVLGHEAAGTIVGVGEAVDRVAHRSAGVDRTAAARPRQRGDPPRPLQPLPAHAVLRHAAGRRRALRLRDHRRGVRPSGARLDVRRRRRVVRAAVGGHRRDPQGRHRRRIARADRRGGTDRHRGGPARPGLRRHRDRRQRSRRVAPRAGDGVRGDDGARPDR